MLPLQNRTSVPFEPVYSDGNARYDLILNIYILNYLAALG